MPTLFTKCVSSKLAHRLFDRTASMRALPHVQFLEKLEHHQAVRPAPGHHGGQSTMAATSPVFAHRIFSALRASWTVYKLSQMQARAITRFQVGAPPRPRGYRLAADEPCVPHAQISYLHHVEENLIAKRAFEEAHVAAVHSGASARVVPAACTALDGPPAPLPLLNSM